MSSGNSVGRPAVWGGRLQRKTITLAQEHIDFLQTIYKKNLSEAIRILIEKSGGPANTTSQYSPNAERPVYIYALCDPDTIAIRYVGKTVSPKTRVSSHMNNRNGTKYGMNPRENWLDKLKSEGKRPLLIILEETNEQEWQEKEREWIDRLIAQGIALLNVSGGGYNGTWIKTYESWDKSPTPKETNNE